jgi:hypothetical protein
MHKSHHIVERFLFCIKFLCYFCKQKLLLKRLMYHTQELRFNQLNNPIKCKLPSAWLGVGYYFWADELDAIKWGNRSKRRTGSYQVYKADIQCENVLDTVFNEVHYNFWLKQIEKAATSISIKTGLKASIKEINLYFQQRVSWKEVDGIMYQDLPFGDELLVVNFNYRKRIQLVAYNLEIITNFALHLEDKCI